MVDGIITRVAPETSQRIDTTAMASVQRKETIKLIRESKAGSDRQEKQAPQGDDAPKTEDVEAGASDHLANFEPTQEMVKSQEEAFQKQLADMAGEKHETLHREYQEPLQDHMGDPLPWVLRVGQGKPEDLKAKCPTSSASLLSDPSN